RRCNAAWRATSVAGAIERKAGMQMHSGLLCFLGQAGGIGGLNLVVRPTASQRAGMLARSQKPEARSQK
ncbi:hypothetical protein, partial [Xanthomonas oryzae]|uniref:hypothetical protein n=1 Tax=Xanthomonas oryzae TaxID=347 RepID=UPI0005191A42